jgi:uncharacterized membrane protein YgaE (UPF0421/DUF939 family)
MFSIFHQQIILAGVYIRIFPIEAHTHQMTEPVNNSIISGILEHENE